MTVNIPDGALALEKRYGADHKARDAPMAWMMQRVHDRENVKGLPQRFTQDTLQMLASGEG